MFIATIVLGVLLAAAFLGRTVRRLQGQQRARPLFARRIDLRWPGSQSGPTSWTARVIRHNVGKPQVQNRY